MDLGGNAARPGKPLPRRDASFHRSPRAVSSRFDRPGALNTNRLPAQPIARLNPKRAGTPSPVPLPIAPRSTVEIIVRIRTEKSAEL